MPSCCCACWWKLLWAAGMALPPIELEKGKCLLYATIHAFLLSDQITSQVILYLWGRKAWLVKELGWARCNRGVSCPEWSPAGLSGSFCLTHPGVAPHLWE